MSDAPASVPSDAPRHLVFRLGAALYGLPLEAVQEVVVPRPPFVRVPRAPASVRGAMNLRGRVVAVVDLAKLLGISSGAAEGAPAAEHVIMLDRGRRGLGFSVGPVLGVEALAGAPESLGAGPASAAASPGPGDLVTGSGTSEQQQRTVALLDPDLLESRGSALFAPL